MVDSWSSSKCWFPLSGYTWGIISVLNMFVPFSPPLQRWQSMFLFELALGELLLLGTRNHWCCKSLATLEELIIWSPISTFHCYLAESSKAGAAEKSTVIGTCSYTRKKLQELRGIVLLGWAACFLPHAHK